MKNRFNFVLAGLSALTLLILVATVFHIDFRQKLALQTEVKISHQDCDGKKIAIADKNKVCLAKKDSTLMRTSLSEYIALSPAFTVFTDNEITSGFIRQLLSVFRQ